MTVEDLIARLQTLPPKALVILASDAEGNGFDTVGEVTEGHYTKENADFTDIPEDAPKEAVQAVCIWP